MPDKNSSQRVTFSPGEFAALFGKSQTWGYRQIYAGKVEAITEYGRMLVPASEVERILGTAGRYDGVKKRPPRTKMEIQAMEPELKNAWREFIGAKRSGMKPVPASPRTAPKSASADAGARRMALARLAARPRKIAD